MKKTCALLLLFSLLFIPAMSMAAELRFGWDPNTEPDLAGYRIHYGQSTGAYTDSVDVGLPETIDGRVEASITVPYGNKYFACTAYNAGGAESDYSNEVMAVIPPSAPGGLKVSSASITYYFVPK